MRVIKRGLRRSRCVVDFWCDLESMGAENTTRPAWKTGELLVSFPGRIRRNSHQSSMPAIRQQHANQYLALVAWVKTGEELPENPSCGGGGEEG
jgi:hypothetical protein